MTFVKAVREFTTSDVLPPLLPEDQRFLEANTDNPEYDQADLCHAHGLEREIRKERSTSS